MHARIALLSPPYSTLVYQTPPHGQNWPLGLRVAVPLGKGIRAGVLLGWQNTEDAPEGIEIKEIAFALEKNALLSPDYLALIHELALRQMVTEGHILGTVLPRGLRVVKQQKEEHVFALAVDPPWPVRPNAAKQIAILEFLFNNGPARRKSLLDALPDSATTLKALVDKGHIRLVAEDEVNIPAENSIEAYPQELLPPPIHKGENFTLSPEQAKTLANLKEALEVNTASTHLLFGITGSGKTVVYLELAALCLRMGKSILLLAPEVALCLKLYRDVQASLPAAPLFLSHGYQSPSQREKTFRALASRQEPCVIVGTRSALFLPVPALGALVLDEEHDGSFKQEEGLPYQAKEIAWQKAAQHNALLLLGSATPDVKTFFAATEGRFALHKLPARVGGGSLPALDFISIRDTATGELLAPQSLAAIRENTLAGDQSVVLLNRRGYAPLMYCLDCGRVARCPDCDIGLTYHKARERLVCHYCGFSRPFPSPCQFCKSLHYLPMGEGTEKLEEQLQSIMPAGGRVLRLDKDSTARTGRMEEILAEFAAGKAHVLVGTQMLSKGHHFPDVTLAVIADADLGLNLPDYRAAERTFQLLTQSAGRAGRAHKEGRVLIQTRDTTHYCWQFVQNADYEGFYKHEIALRKKHLYPPFTKLALIRFSFPPDFPEPGRVIRTITPALRETAQKYAVRLLGPIPSPLPRLNGRFRYQCLLKASSWPAIRAVYASLGSNSELKHIRLSLDLDPMSMV